MFSPELKYDTLSQRYRHAVSSIIDGSPVNGHVNIEELRKLLQLMREYSYFVSDIIDGDTVVVVNNGKEERLRLLGVAAPESVGKTKPKEYCGSEAAEIINELKGEKVRIEYQVDSAGNRIQDDRGRFVANIFLFNGRDEGELISDRLFMRGFARIYSHDFFQVDTEQNTNYRERFFKIERDAQEGKDGVWGDGDCVRPEKFKAAKDCDVIASKYPGKHPGREIRNYHDPECPIANKIKLQNIICFKNEEEARNNGYVECNYYAEPLQCKIIGDPISHLYHDRRCSDKKLFHDMTRCISNKEVAESLGYKAGEECQNVK